MEQKMTNNHITIGILAHVDAGKTTLSEAMLYSTGQIRSLGRVDHQDAYLDNDAQERERGITIFSKQARLDISRGTNAADTADTARTADVARTADTARTWHVVMLDTPGHVDFSAEMERTLQVLDYAILVISATDGVQGHTRTLWRLLKHYNVPTFIFVNKMDMQGTDEEKVQAELKSELSDGCVDFSSQDLFDELAMCSEPLLDEFMESGELADAHIAQAVAQREVFPCFYGSALKLDRVDTLIQGLSRFMCERNYPDEFSARVYKIGRDDRGSRLTFLKVTGGCLRVRDKIEYKAHGGDEAKGPLIEKIDQIRKYSGEKYEIADVAEAGEIVAVTGLSSTFPGQGLGFEQQSNMPILEPVLNYRMILPDDVNPAAFMEKLKQLEEEDPQLYIVWVEEFKEIHVQLMGQVQMEVLVRLIKDRFGVVVTFGPGSIVYKETIARAVEGVGHFEPLRHYAEVHLLLSPAERGSGITVTSTCSEDVLDKNWQRLIATHVEEKEHRGVLTGSALTDVKVTILTGRAHVKHTEGGDFRQATYRAIRQGLKSTESVLLEPYYSFILQVPMEYVGRAMTDLEQRFARAESPQFATTAAREMATITGKAPVATMQDYVSLVHAYTKGLGHLTLELWGYDECHNPAEVIAQMHYDSEEDFRNPTGSVFCAHGSGYVVPWDEVPEHMHLPYVCHGDESEEALAASARTQNAFSAEDAQALAGNRRRMSFEKVVSGMSSVELDAQLADVYAREFGMGKNDIAEDQRRKWSGKKKNEYEGLSGKPRTVKHDKHGNPIYPKKSPGEEYLIVDGYNIIFAWEDLNELSRINIDSARDALKDVLSDYQGYKGCHLLLVFDAYKVKGNAGKRETFHNIEVVYTKQDETADAFIEKTVFGIRDRYKVTVATSDGLEQQTVMSLGALRMSARELKEHIEMTKRAGMEAFISR